MLMQRVTPGMAMLLAAVLCAAVLSGCVGPRKESARVTRTNPAWRPPDANTGR